MSGTDFAARGLAAAALSGQRYSGNIRNANPAALKRWRAAKAAARSGTANARLLAAGDSTTRGQRSGSGTAQVSTSWPKYFADIIAARSGVPVGIDSFYGTGSGGGASNLTGIDSRFSALTGTWLGSTSTIGGRILQAAAAASITWTPIKAVDTYDIYYIRNTSNGVFSYSINGGTAVNVDTVGARSIIKLTVTAALGISSITFAWVSGSIFVIGLEAYNSAIKQISVINAGWSSSEAVGQWGSATSNPWEPINFVPTLAPDLVVLDLGLNDMNNGALTSAQYATAMNRMLDTWLPTSDVVLKSFLAPATTWATIPRQLEFLQVLYDISDARKIPLIDVYRARGAYTDDTSLFDGGNVHQSTKGYANIADYASEMAFL